MSATSGSLARAEVAAIGCVVSECVRDSQIRGEHWSQTREQHASAHIGEKDAASCLSHRVIRRMVHGVIRPVIHEVIDGVDSCGWKTASTVR